LSFNIHSLNNQMNNPLPRISVTTQITPATGFNSPDIQIGNVSGSTYYYLATAIIVMACALVYLKSRGEGRKGARRYILESQHPGKLATLIALGMIVLMFFGFEELVRRLALIAAPSNPSHITFDPAQYLVLFAFGAIVATSSFGLFSLFRAKRSAVSAISQRPNVRVSENKAEEFRAVLDRAADSLGHDSDYRSTIIQTYKALCSVLEEGGIHEEASLTPREFELVAGRKLGILSEYLHEVTLLFEKARYGNEDIDSEEVFRAKECLRSLSSEIERKSARSYPLVPQRETPNN
ncbi:MAG: DUF4129 domain-containing protein, partial [Nitrososphaerales archaeon]